MPFDNRSILEGTKRFGGLAFFAALLLLVMPSHVISLGNAYAEHQDSNGQKENSTESQFSGHDDPQKDKLAKNNSTTSSNQGDTHNSFNENKGRDFSAQSKAAKHQTFADMYLPNMNYTITAAGKALVLSNHSRMDAQNTSLTFTLSVWKSWRSLVWMNVTGGTVTLGNTTLAIHGGHAYFLHNSRLVLTGDTLNIPSSNSTKAHEHQFNSL